ncbi:MAG: hypothetical protein ACREBY_02260, partial [Polaromonas sp.]
GGCGTPGWSGAADRRGGAFDTVRESRCGEGRLFDGIGRQQRSGSWFRADSALNEKRHPRVPFHWVSFIKSGSSPCIAYAVCYQINSTLQAALVAAGRRAVLFADRFSMHLMHFMGLFSIKDSARRLSAQQAPKEFSLEH